MNNKIEIWKRKLAKEHHRQQMQIWDRLKYEQTFNSEITRFASAWSSVNVDFSSAVDDEIGASLAKMLLNEIDKEILQSLTNDSKTKHN